jgi:hypothetical protein
MGELDRHPPDSASRTGDQYALAEHQACDLKRPQRCQPVGGKGGGLDIRKEARDRRQAADRDRGQLCPRSCADQPHHTGARGRPAAVTGRSFDNAGDIPASHRSRGAGQQARTLRRPPEPEARRRAATATQNPAAIRLLAPGREMTHARPYLDL